MGKGYGKRERYNKLEQIWGDEPEAKQEDEMRITSTNIHGFSYIDEAAEYILGAQQFGSDIACFQEINMDTHNVEVIQGIRRAIHSVEDIKGSTFQATSIQKSNHKSIKKMGGTMIHVERKWAGSSMKKESDTYGRWSKVTIEGKESNKIAIYSVYRVNGNSLEKAGGDTVWMQEYQALLENGVESPNPRQQILDDLEADIHATREDGETEIIVCIDANESTRKEGVSKLKLFRENTGLEDIHGYLHSDLEETPTYAEGSKQIDYILASPRVLQATNRGGILPINYMAQSDHRTLYIDIDIKEILGGKHKAPTGPPTRILKLRNVKALERFQDQLKEYWKQHRMNEKMECIAKGFIDTTNSKDERQHWRQQLESWDKLSIELMLASEKGCRRTAITSTYAWSKPLMLAGQRVTYWKTRKRMQTAGTTIDGISGYGEHLHNKFGYSTKTLTNEEVKTELKAAWKNLREIQKEDKVNRQRFMEELAEQRAKEQHISISSAIKQIQNAEKSRDSHSKFNYYLKEIRKGAIDHLLIPIGEDPDGVFGKQ